MNTCRAFNCNVCGKMTVENHGRMHIQSIDCWGRICAVEVCEECFDKCRAWMNGRGTAI